MIKILDSNLNLLAYFDLYTNAVVHERINQDYSMTFTAVIDEEKSPYIINGNIVEVEDQYFNIVRTRRTRDQVGQITIGVYCEQKSYDLLHEVWPEFIQGGTPEDLLTILLTGTDFTVGTVELTDIISIDIREETASRSILMAIASAAGGELLFDKFEISLLQQRGQNRGVQFRFGKNLLGIIKDVDNSSGVQKIAYEIDIVELNSLPEYEGLEYFELGDTVRIVDPELGIDELQRIVEYDYDPKQRINSKVTIANFVDAIQDTMYQIQTTTIVKNKLYYNTRIGPEVGFEATRSDQKGRAVMNGDGIVIQRGDGLGGYTNAIYLDVSGDAVFEGTIHATGGTFAGDITASGTITGGTITGALLQNQTAAADKVFMDVDGFHSNDSSGVIRVEIATTPADGAKAIMFYGVIGPGGDQGLITYDSNSTSDGTFTGLFAVGPSAQLLLFSDDGDFRLLNDQGSGIRAISNSRPEIRTGIGAWNGIAVVGASTGAGGASTGGIPIGTILSVSGGGTVTWTGIPAHSHTQT